MIQTTRTVEHLEIVYSIRLNIMLEDLIYEAKGKVTGIRVLNVKGGIPKIEVLLHKREP